MALQLVRKGGSERFALTVGVPLVVGRAVDCHVKLTDLHASRKHCELISNGRSATVTDLGSASGTFINGQRVATGELKTGDVLRVGETELQLELDVANQSTLQLPAIKKSEAVTANRPEAPPLPAPVKRLHELVGASLGKYRIERVLGSGQLGVVFLARDGADGKLLALKVLRDDFAKDAKAVQRFVRGMLSAKAFSHPHLVELYNAGFAQPYCWIAMEYVEGGSLAALQQGPMEWPTALAIGIQATQALVYLHDRDVLHRSVMPKNILIHNADRSAKLSEVMFASTLKDAGGPVVAASLATVDDAVYRAPERFGSGDADARADARADIYSLGVTLYQLLAGRLPFQAGSLAELLDRIAKDQPERLVRFQPDIPAPFEAAVLRMVAKEPRDRFVSAREMLGELSKIPPPVFRR